MIWRIYLFKRVSSLVTLMEKVGKAPKDRLCKKEIDMDTATATEFMNIVCDYMEIFMQVLLEASIFDYFDHMCALPSQNDYRSFSIFFQSNLALIFQVFTFSVNLFGQSTQQEYLGLTLHCI